MDDDLVGRLAGTRTIEITTIGRRTGRGVRIEIWWFHVDGRFIITGTPGPRDWLANLQADPRLVVHALGRDLPAGARVVDDRTFRRRFFAQSNAEVRWYTSQAQLDDLIRSAPMIEVCFE